jgi:hypothetical protein
MENPETDGKPQYRWTVLPQGLTESPNLFGQVFEQILEKLEVPPQVKLFQCMDDMLIS